MKKTVAALLVCALAPIYLYAANNKQITIERIFESPELDGSLSMSFKFSPNGERLSFLRPKPGNFEVLDLWEYDLKTGNPRELIDSAKLKFGELSEEEKARRERMRVSRKGIIEYYWFNDGQRIALPAAGDLYLYSIKSKELKRLTQDSGTEVDVKVSPKDNYISFTRDQNLYVLNTKTAKTFAVTSDGKDVISNGVAEFIAQEEMGRFTGYWWSEDERYLAYVRVDETPVKIVDRYDIGADKIVVHKQRYPEAGTANAIVQLAVVKVEDVVNGKAQPQWVDLGPNKDIYLTNAKWNSSGQLVYQVQSRDQKKLEVFAYNPEAKKHSRLFNETDSKWLNLNDNSDIYMFEKSARWIWASERSGFKHLYLYSNDGKLIRPLTRGDWPVTALLGVDEENGWIYFAASKESPLERNVYRVSIEKPGSPERITKLEGWNSGTFNKKADVFVHFYSSPTDPPRVYLRRADGHEISTLNANEVNEKHPLFPYKDSIVAPEFGSFKIASGETLYYQLYKPKDFDPKKKYPLIVSGYGGPHVQVVRKAWSGKYGFYNQTLLNKGFLVASIDNRGSFNRGKKFENHLYRAFGTVEVADQVAGVKHLIAQGFVDPERVGFWGHSYGGYLAMNLAVKAPGVFKAHVASAPVTDFALYDTHYTERYLGNPRKDPEVYKRASTLPYVAKMTGHLLVIHGMADDNVMFSNSTMLFRELQKAGKVYESVTYPGAKHGIYGRENQIHLHKTMTDFFERRLLK